MLQSNGLRGLGMARRPFSVFVLLWFLSLGAGGLLPPTTAAQRASGAVNVGLQAGSPGGLTGKLYRSRRHAYAGLLTTDGTDTVELYVYRLRERPLPDSLLHLYAGPGLLLGTQTLDERTPTPGFGLTVQVGLNFYAERFEVFLHATPVLRVSPTVQPELGGSVGLRYLLHPP